jgi:hypothetical protein
MEQIKNITDNPTCKILKIPLKRIFKDNDIENIDFKYKIDDAISRVNKIVSRTYDFIKLYILYCFNNNMILPDINSQFIADCFNVLCDKSKKGAKTKEVHKVLSIKDDLLVFYEMHYKLLLTDNIKISKSNLNQILREESTKICVCFENSIKTNYFIFLFRYINCIFMEQNKNIIDNFEKESDKRTFIYNLKTELKKVKNDILNNTLNSDVKYHTWIKESYDRIIPLYNTIVDSKTNEKSYYYDIKVSTFKYLKYLLNMNLELENIGKKMFSPIPLRRSLIPKFIYIDTVAIIELSNLTNKTQYYKNVIKYQEFIWSKYFNFNNKIFKNRNNYVFNYTIQTDGIDTSITFKRKDLKDENGRNKKPRKQINNIEEFKYLENYKQFELLEIKNNNNIVYCDPGKCRLLYMLDERKNKILQYTNKQRVYETQRLKYSNIRERMKKESGIEEKEKVLNNCNSKTCKLEVFKKYIKTKELLSNEIENYYSNEKFRKFRMRVFINTKRSEQKLINTIKNTYTTNKVYNKEKKKNPLIVIGNWCISHQMRNMMSTPCIGLKRLLNNNFKMITMDEFRTSCLNYRNEERVENMKDKKTGKKIHSVLILKEKEKVIGCINRDRNAVYNYKKIFNSYINTGVRPERFDRSYKL